MLTPDTKLAIAHWECVRQADEEGKKAKQKARHAYSWVAPRDAAAPLNHFDTLYLRLTRIHRGLMREAGKYPDVLNSTAFAELVDSCAELAKTAAEMTTVLEEIRRDFPELWDVWCASVIDEKPSR